MAVSGALRESQALFGSGLGLEDVGEDPLCRAVDGHKVDEVYSRDPQQCCGCASSVCEKTNKIT